jgi:tetratricopeptide (TPR) repeat protein
LGRLGIEGLVRQRQFDLLRQLMAKYGIEPRSDDGFYLVWMKGQQQYFDAAKNSSSEGYGEAAATLRAALSDPQAAKDLAAAGRCRYLLGWCLYRLEQREQAARQFEQAADALRGSGEKDAVDSAWMAFVCYKELADAEPARVSLAIDALEKLKRDYPNSEQAGRADFLLARLRKAAASLEESIASLEAIEKGDDNYLSARYELCLLYHQRWVKQRNDPERGEKAASQLRAAIDTFLAAAKNDDPQRRLRCLLLGVDAAMGGVSPDESAAQQYLALSEPLAVAIPAESSLAADYHYRALQFARRQNDSASQERHAAWLAENAGDSSYALASLIVLARAADQAVADSPSESRRGRVEEAADVYTRLVARLGSTSEAIAAERNARAANSKLAEYEFDLGRYDEAARRLDVLLAAFPDQQDYLRRGGLAHFHAGQFEAALANWRTLLAGVPANSTEWYEAKYYQLSCLARVDRDQARKVYQQLRLLHPEIADPTWGEKLNELGTSLGG